MNRPCIKVELPDNPEVSEIWAANGNRYINQCAQEGAKLRYERGGYNANLPGDNAQAIAEEMDIIQQQLITPMDAAMLRMIRGLAIGWEQSQMLFQYGVMVGKRIEREKRSKTNE